jgi:serine/threonine-protein kinase RsbW
MIYAVDVQIRNDVSDIAVVRDTLDNLSHEFSIPVRALTQLQVALDEVVSNVIKYAWDDDGQHVLVVRITVRPERVDLDIFDDGRAFNPMAAPSPERAPEGQRPWPGGLGIHLIRKLVDHFAYERIGGRNHTTLGKMCSVGTAVQRSDRMNALSIGQTRAGNVCVVTLSGRVDSTNANDLMAVLTRLISSGEKSMLVDLSNVLYLTSAAFRALLVASDGAARQAATFALCGVGGHVRELFEMAGLLDVFAVHNSRDEALKQLG